MRRYDDRMIDLNEYLALLPGAKASDKCFDMELNGIILNRMPNVWSRQAYVQGFDFEYITLKSINMFELMEIVEKLWRYCRTLL